MNSRLSLSLVLLISMLPLISCGGGGSSGGPTPLPAANILVIQADLQTARDDVLAKLAGFAVFGQIDGFDAQTGTPTLVALQAYDAVLVISDSNFADADALGSVLADYIDSGGGVVLGMFSMSSPGSDTPDGRFVTDNYYCINRSLSNGSISNGGMTVLDAAHPILTDVSTFAGGHPSFSPAGSTLAPGAALIATWDDVDSTPLIATRTISGTRRADLGFYPVTTDGDPGKLDPTSDAMRIVANALRWVSNRL